MTIMRRGGGREEEERKQKREEDKGERPLPRPPREQADESRCGKSLALHPVCADFPGETPTAISYQMK